MDSLLLEQDRPKTSVERTESLILIDLAESTDKPIGIRWVGDETDTGSFKRAEGNIGEEFCEGRRGQVNGCAIVGGSLVSEDTDGLLLEEFITSKLECSLKEIPSSGGTETG
jgi:hypothetical protein